MRTLIPFPISVKAEYFRVSAGPCMKTEFTVKRTTTMRRTRIPVMDMYSTRFVIPSVGSRLLALVGCLIRHTRRLVVHGHAVVVIDFYRSDLRFRAWTRFTCRRGRG